MNVCLQQKNTVRFDMLIHLITVVLAGMQVMTASWSSCPQLYSAEAATGKVEKPAPPPSFSVGGIPS